VVKIVVWSGTDIPITQKKTQSFAENISLNGKFYRKSLHKRKNFQENWKKLPKMGVGRIPKPHFPIKI